MAMVSWRRPMNSNGQIVTYIINAKDASGSHVCTKNLTCGDCLPPCQRTTERSAKTLGSNEFSATQELFNRSIQELYPFTGYSVTVTPLTVNFTGQSQNESFQTSEDVPGEVSNITVEVINKTVSVDWMPPLVPNGDIIAYNVTLGNKTVTTTNTSTGPVELEYDTCYNISVTASTSAGTGPASDILTHTDSGVSQQVQDLKITEITSKTAMVSWRRPMNSNGQIVTYIINVKNASGSHVCTKNLTCGDCLPPCQPTTERSANILRSNEFSATQELFNTSVQELYPFTGYSVTVTPLTINFTGQSQNESFQTSEDVPRKPVNVRCVPSETNVSVTWSKERPRGNTSFYVITYDSRPMGSNVEENTTCNGQPCIVTGLTPYWNYTLQVVAHNKKGTTSSDIKTVTTLEDKPGPVTNLTVKEPDDVTQARSLTITWNPPLPRHRHGLILRYSVLTTSFDTKCRMSNNLTTNDTRVHLTKDIKPECVYIITVKAATSRGEGVEVSKQLTTTAGAPPSPSGIQIMKSGDEVGDPKRQISLRIADELLCDTSQGKILVWGVIVLRDPKLATQTYRGPRSKYHVPASQIAANRSFTSASCPVDDKHVVVGDGRCGIGWCSSPLEPDTPYRFKVFVCTSMGCTETLPSQIFRTESEDSNTVIVGVVSGVVLIVLASLLVAVLYKLWKKKMSVRPSVHFDPATIELGMKKLSLVSESQKSRPVKLQNFADHVEYLHRDSNLGFSEEYKALKQLSPKHPTKAAEQQACRTKNRYTNVLPFDHSRVKLLSQDDEEGSDYINANFITGYMCKREYIAAQGPLPCTKDDFWRLIWEHRIGMIVMLTQCKERGRIKCEKYWPDNTDPVYFGDLIVQLRSESVLPDYVIRILDVKQGNKKRVIRHFHFLKWPDFGCPEKTWLLLNFVSAVRAHMPHHQDGPTLVHCSAGVGRTGTFIAVDYLLQQVKEHNEVDIFALVMQMRENRPLMVQTENQYIYIHDCIRDALQEDTDDEGSLEEEEEEEEEEPIYQNT